MANMTQRFVVLAAPRTGSNLLCTLLNSHPEILCHHEVFNPNGIFLAVSHRGRAQSLGKVEERDRAPLAFLHRVWDTGCGYRCIGFKWTRGQVDSVLQHVSRDAGVKKIVLRRNNRVKTYVSERIAQVTGQWEVYDEHDLHWPRPRIAVDPNELRGHIAGNEQFYADLEVALARSSQPCTVVCYEDLFHRDKRAELLAFLGVDDCRYPLRAASVKQNPTDLKDSIANYSELVACLQGSDLLAELCDRDL